MVKRNFSIISAVALNGVIGNSSQNAMPWHLPSDLKHFKSATSGSTVVMGHRTFLSIGKPLPNRRNVVVSSKPSTRHDLVSTHKVDVAYSSFDAVVENEADDFFCYWRANCLR